MVVFGGALVYRGVSSAKPVTCFFLENRYPSSGHRWTSWRFFMIQFTLGRFMRHTQRETLVPSGMIESSPF